MLQLFVLVDMRFYWHAFQKLAIGLVSKVSYHRKRLQAADCYVINIFLDAMTATAFDIIGILFVCDKTHARRASKDPNDLD